MQWELFDPDEEVRITAGRLPHWFQPGRLFFITFRTNDSLPASVAKLWLKRRDDWLRRQGIDPRSKDWGSELQSLPAPLRRQFHETFSEEFLAHLDRGYGQCVLRRPSLAAIVVEGLSHFDGDRYALSDFVVMPNHVHVLVGLLGDTDVLSQCSSWKKNTALGINKALGRRGRFWHEESFDHLVRSEGQFEAVRQYIAENPLKAGLREGEYVAWRGKIVRRTRRVR